jgi:hypothetical protein
MAALPQLIPFPGRRPTTGDANGEPHSEIDAPTPAAREENLEAMLARVRQKWGYGSIVRLDRGDALAATKRPRRPKTERELPPWWPHPLGPDAAAGVLRPRLLEIVAEPGSGRLTLALAWLAAARPALVAIVDIGSPRAVGAAGVPAAAAGGAGVSGSGEASRPPVAEWPERFYPPAAVTAGLDPRQLIVVHPPPGDRRAALDAVVVLLRSEAFDAVLCPLPPRARVSTSFASKLATFATRANTSLLLLTVPVYGADGCAAAQGGALAAFADYRVRLGTRRWLWADGELAGMKLRATTERARGAAALGALDAPESGNAGQIAHDLTFRLHARARYGPSGADHLSLTASVRIVQQPQPGADEELTPLLRVVSG